MQLQHLTVSIMRDEKIVRDTVRLELACACALAASGHGDLMQDILAKCTPEQRAFAVDELKKLEEWLRLKSSAVDEA